MNNLEKYHGVIPAFYACYDDDGNISPKRVRALTRYLIDAGVKGTYVCGSSGECIYQSKEERKTVLENVVAEANGRLTIIAHVACNNTADSMELAAHAESLGVDAIALSHPYISIFQNMELPNTGMISQVPLLSQILLFTISPNLQGFLLHLLYSERCAKIHAS